VGIFIARIPIRALVAHTFLCGEPFGERFIALTTLTSILSLKGEEVNFPIKTGHMVKGNYDIWSQNHWAINSPKKNEV
jgi:hypothetical protein